jgi:myo-inositol-1-phosphate synthase
LNFGGNMDFKNMLERERLQSKKISKTQSVTSQITGGIDAEDIHIGPSDHVPWLKDRKWAYIRIEGREFGNIPISMELKLEVWDSPNSAGVVIDAIRCIKLAMDRGEGGPLLAPSAYFMKSPPVQYTDSEAKELVDAFIRGDDSEFLVRSAGSEYSDKASDPVAHTNGSRGVEDHLDLEREFEPRQ